MSRNVRRMQGKDSLLENKAESDEEEHFGICGGRRNDLPENPYDLLNEQSHSQSETEHKDQDNDNAENECVPENGAIKRKKNKKKKKNKNTNSNKNFSKNHNPNNNKNVDNEEIDIDAEIEAIESALGASAERQPVKQKKKSTLGQITAMDTIGTMVLGVQFKHLNVTNELCRIFGPIVVESENRRRFARRGMKPTWFITPKENWPPISNTGISMSCDRKPPVNFFTIQHSNSYRQLQWKFLNAVDTLNPEHIVAIINRHPYHIDSLIQLSEICKMNDDIQRATDLIERAIHCFECGFHPLFHATRGNCKMLYQRQENRAFYICLFKHMIFVGQRACYQTALEISKFILTLDFENDPMAVVLCMDFYAIRSKNYNWFLSASQEWAESRKKILLLPNFAFGTALAHFFISKRDHTDTLEADKFLQDALILFPGVLLPLLEMCSLQPDARVSSHAFFRTQAGSMQNQPLSHLILLYIHRSYHDWKLVEVVPWLEKNVHAVLDRVDAKDPYVRKCAVKRDTRYRGTPRNVLRHILLSDIKEVVQAVSVEIHEPVLNFDPLPPLNVNNTYERQEQPVSPEQDRAFALFFRSIWPHFRVDLNTPLHEIQMMDELAAQAQDAIGLVDGIAARAPGVGGSLRESVNMLMEAIGQVLSNLPLRDQENNGAQEENNGAQEENNGAQEENNGAQEENNAEGSEAATAGASGTSNTPTDSNTATNSSTDTSNDTASGSANVDPYTEDNFFLPKENASSYLVDEYDLSTSDSDSDIDVEEDDEVPGTLDAWFPDEINNFPSYRNVHWDRRQH